MKSKNKNKCRFPPPRMQITYLRMMMKKMILKKIILNSRTCFCQNGWNFYAYLIHFCNDKSSIVPTCATREIAQVGREYSIKIFKIILLTYFLTISKTSEMFKNMFWCLVSLEKFMVSSLVYGKARKFDSFYSLNENNTENNNKNTSMMKNP